MNQYNVNHIKIDPKLFQHPVDKALSEKIVQMEAFQKVLQFISKNSIEKQMGILYRSSLAQLTPKNAPKIFEMLQEAAGMFDVPVIPEVYLQRTYPLFADMLGADCPMIIISTTFLEEISEKSLWGVLASEMAGIKNGYCSIKFVEWLCNSSAGLIPDVLIAPLQLAFQNWHKYAQYSFDRATLIAAGDFNAVMQEILAGEAPKEVLASIRFDDPNCDYMKQCREFLSNEDKLTSTIRDVKSVFSKNSYYAARYIELFKFYQSEYFDLVEDYMD